MPMYPDSDLGNADWPKKKSWDVWTSDGQRATTLALMREAMASYSDQDFKELLKLPYLPPQLRREIEAL